ncbi:unnamed protein product [Linum trigynum]|uniref:Uncharacterized protein n=1 Tax=Linum trigynum TaxID=586398 RepID=A0AAV2DZU8_9ROSI
MKRIHAEAVAEGKRLFGPEIVLKVLEKAPSYTRKGNSSSQREKDLEARLEETFAEGERQRKEFEDQIHAQQEQIENQQHEIHSQKDIIKGLQASQETLTKYVEALAAQIDGRQV